MTANQLQYQANKIREQENLIKQQQADIAQQAQDLKKSEHIHEYGQIFTDANQHPLEGIKVWKDMSQVSKNIFGGASDLFKLMK